MTRRAMSRKCRAERPAELSGVVDRHEPLDAKTFKRLLNAKTRKERTVYCLGGVYTLVLFAFDLRHVNTRETNSKYS